MNSKQLEELVKVVAGTGLDTEAKILALVALLADKGIITTDEFDRYHEEVKKIQLKTAKLMAVEESKNQKLN
jgi:hypothetical protein